MKQQCIQKYGKNLDFVREPKGLARRLKHKFYNPVKSKIVRVEEFRYIFTVIYTVLEI